MYRNHLSCKSFGKTSAPYHAKHNRHIYIFSHSVHKRKKNYCHKHNHYKSSQRYTGLKLHKLGITDKMVSSHSLRVEGTMVAHLNGVDSDTLKKLGRWSSDIYLMYIHDQIAHLNTGIGHQMSTHLIFRNILAPAITDTV